VSSSGSDRPVRFDHPDGTSARRKRRALYIAFNAIVTLIVALALFEALVGSSVYGVDTATTRATAADTQLEVRHPTVTRGQLAVSLEVTVTRQTGFAEPIMISITADYLSLFVTQGPNPDPSSETANAEDLILTFEPPLGDTFVVEWNLQAKAVGSFTTANAHVAVVDSAQQPTVAVEFATKVRP
jgi:hypothetical protein